MATYATYRHIELDNVGCGKKRVLKPPGGGTSDIFSQQQQQQQQQNGVAENGVGGGRRPVRNNAQNSTLFMSDDVTDAPAAATPLKQQGNDSHTRLFGAMNNAPTPSSRHRMKSNIVFGQEQQGPPPTPADSIDGNPVTGEGYTEEKTNGGMIMNGNGSNGDTSMTNGGTPKSRVRVPPGGFSTGFW